MLTKLVTVEGQKSAQLRSGCYVGFKIQDDLGVIKKSNMYR